jgi:hypothetical protein
MIEPILITGCARSGTSMTAGIIHMGGAWGGVMSGPTSNNRKGMFENSEIRQYHVKPYLRSIKADHMGQDPLPNLEDSDIVEKMCQDGGTKWRTEILRVLERQGYQRGPWFYKGAKMCLMWPLWDQAFPKAKWIIVRRDAEDIVNSCMRTGFMRAFTRPAGWREWVRTHERRFQEMHDAGLDIREVWPQKLINKQYSEMIHITNEFGLTWDEQQVRMFITPKLWKGGKNGSSSDQGN